jgi:V/A-type H+/Na+-transporting ATPase subunit C
MSPEERGLVLAWARKYALFNLKTLLRGKIRQLDPQEIRENLYDLPPQVRLSNEDLFRTESAVELLRCLEDGPLSLLARQAREIYEKRQEAFALEAAIDQRYYSELARRVTRLGDAKADRQMRTLIGSLVDRANILWLLRFRFAYGLAPSETFYQLVPSPNLLYRQRLLDLVSLESQAQVIAALPEPLRSLLADADNLMESQRRLSQYCYGIARDVLRQGHSGVARAMGLSDPAGGRSPVHVHADPEPPAESSGTVRRPGPGVEPGDLCPPLARCGMNHGSLHTLSHQDPELRQRPGGRS